ncbi:MAG TPA: DUF3570 domain-containing protein [Opitutaceae bacterium]
MRVNARPFRPLIVAAILEILWPRVSHADGEVNYKFQSWQEASGRIHVDSQAGEVEQGLPDDIRLKLTGVIDTISGATPTGQLTIDPNTGTIPMTQMTDRRKAWTVDGTKPFGSTTIDLGYANSRESDYISNGYSLNTQTTFNEKNTTLLLGIAGTDDKVKVFFQNPWEKKQGRQAIIGVTQLIDPDTSVTVNFSVNHSSGFLSDPYKLIEQHVDLGQGLILLSTFGENRPTHRDADIFFASVNHNVRPANATVQFDYRFYHDTFGINAHTLAVQWLQKLFNDHVVLTPSLRIYEQSAAFFYKTTLDGSVITAGNTPNPDGPFFSADYRLSKMRTIDTGLKIVFRLIPNRLSIDAAYDRYEMKGRDQITPKAEYTNANVYSIGARFEW